MLRRCSCRLDGSNAAILSIALIFAASDAYSVSRVSFQFVRDYLSRARPWVQIAKAAITSDHVRDAFFYRAVLAVPVHSTCPDVYYCAPRGITKSLARRSSKRRCRSKSSDTKCQFRKGFQHDEPSSDFLLDAIVDHLLRGVFFNLQPASVSTPKHIPQIGDLIDRHRIGTELQ